MDGCAVVVVGDFSQLLPIEWARERHYDDNIGCRLVPIVKQEMSSMEIHCDLTERGLDFSWTLQMTGIRFYLFVT